MRTYGSIRADELTIGDVVEVHDAPMTVADMVVLPTQDSHVRQRPGVILVWHDDTGTGRIDPDELFLLRAPRRRPAL